MIFKLYVINFINIVLIMGIGCAIYRPFCVYGDVTPRIIRKLNEWITNRDFFGWVVEYAETEDAIIIELQENSRGHIKEYIKTLIKFLNVCLKYELYITDSIPYYVDDESGGIYICSETKKAKLIGITSSGDIVKSNFRWK